jgi:cellulose synthase/poly-beta-1,6-N-acetylglucosamine synthase-like glycosyltransferase
VNKLSDWRWWVGKLPREVAKYHPKNYTISVIIPAHNEEASIADTIESIKNQSVRIDRILVVDDHSSDATSEVALSCGVDVVRTHVNQGTKAMAQNYVLHMIDTDLFVTIDGDTLLHENAIERTLVYFNDQKVASVCGQVIPQKIETMWERGRFIEYLFGISLFKEAQSRMGAVLVSSGCFSVFRTDIVKKMGGFKQRTMAEDMDLTWNLHLHGYKVRFDPYAFCYPIDPPTFKVYVNQIMRWTSSFFQNISIYKLRLFKHQIGFFILMYLLDGILTPIISVILYFVTLKVWAAVLLSSGVLDLGFLSALSLIKGARIGMFKTTLYSLPCSLVVRYVNMIVFYRCLVREWILGRRLTTWEKGH